VAGLALFTGLVAYSGLAEVADAVAVAGWGLAWLAVYHLIPVTAAAEGWRRLLRPGHRLPLRTMFLARWLGESINDLLPVAGVGGNIAKARVIAQRGVPGVEAGASVVVDVTLVVLTQILFTVLGLGLFVVQVGGGRTALQAATSVVLMALIAAGLWVTQRRGFFGGLARMMERVVRGRDLDRLTGGADALDAAVVQLYRDRRAVAASTVWHLVTWLVGTGETWLALRLLGHPVGLLEALLLESLGQAVRTAGFIVPGGLGVQEGGFMALGSTLGLHPETALALSLAKRVPELLLGVPGLLVWQLDLARERPDGVGAAGLGYRPHALVRSANWAARPFLPFVRLESADLLAEAERQTGLDDFGDDSFREPLDVLLRAYDTEARLTLAGRIAARTDTLRLLANRLRLEADRKAHPEIAAQEIRRPLFIVSLARAGTTLLHRLLAQDPANRVPLSWELMFPTPPPERAHHDTDPRIARAERQLRWFEALLAPDIRAIHQLGARLPEECLIIMAHSLRSFQFPSMHHVPSYQQWLETHDLGPAYEYHRRVLQHLQWRCPAERWVLKAPAHLFGIEPLFATYPDAGVIHMHRDPLEVTASLASLTLAIYAAFSDDVDPRVIGRELSDSLVAGLERYLRARDDGPARAARFLDVDYRDLVRDPIATVRRIYAFFAVPLTAEAVTRMRRFLAENPKDRHGEHRYALAQFGLDPAEEARRFRGYCERFGV
jgi:putative membrane protein